MITSGATKLFDKKQQKEIIIRCHRHGDVYHTIADLGFGRLDFKTIEQGFIDYDADKRIERFVTREEAKQIAIDNNQIISGDKFLGHIIFTEDLW
jgi:hypothetical protein